MFANDKNIDNLQQLFVELKKYAEASETSETSASK